MLTRRRLLYATGAAALAAAWALRGRLAGVPARPQTPVAPFPYVVREIAFAQPAADLALAGSLTLPRTPGPHPAIVLVPGSGPVDRDGTLAGHRFYLVLADALTRRGFAVLRSDKRGLGASGGDFASATTLDFAADLRAALAFLRALPEIDGARIGLAGHSEGALVATMVAAEDARIAFTVLMAANGIPMGEVLAERLRRFAPPGQSAQALERELALQRAVFAAATAPGSDAARSAAVRGLYQDARARYGRPFSEEEFAAFLTPWMRTLLGIDPQPLLRRIRGPVLALAGDRDRVVPPDDNLPALGRALAANPRAELRRLPRLNHFFQTAERGEPSEVEEIEETMAPAALELIASWSARQAGLARTSGAGASARPGLAMHPHTINVNDDFGS